MAEFWYLIMWYMVTCNRKRTQDSAEKNRRHLDGGVISRSRQLRRIVPAFQVGDVMLDPPESHDSIESGCKSMIIASGTLSWDSSLQEGRYDIKQAREREISANRRQEAKKVGLHTLFLAILL